MYNVKNFKLNCIILLNLLSRAIIFMCIICVILFIVNLIPENEKLKLCDEEEYNKLIYYIEMKIIWKSNPNKSKL